jgi:hypothetical protein
MALSFNDAITDKWIEHLKGIDELQYLALPDGAGAITDRSMEIVSSLAGLKYLSLSGLPNVSAKGLKCLHNLTQLKHLTFSAMPVTSDVIQQLAPLSQLEVLELPGCRRLGTGLRGIGKFRNLRYLDLRGACLAATSEDMGGLAQLHRLTYLDLRYNTLTADSLKHLANLRNLRSLKLEGNRRINDASLRHLHLLKNLRYLDVRATSVTPDGVWKLQRQLPNLKSVCHDPGISYRRIRWALAIAVTILVIFFGFRYCQHRRRSRI